MDNKKIYRFLSILSLVILAGFSAIQTFAGSGQPTAVLLKHFETAQPGVEKTAPEIAPLSPLAGERVWTTDTAPLIMPPQPDATPGAACNQLLLNTKLDVLELGDGTGTAEPWVVLWPNVYYDDTVYTSPNYSLVVVIGDSGDDTPYYDGFGQAFYMPAGLTSVHVEYSRKINNVNSIDELYGDLWSVDNQGYLVSPPIASWTIGDSPAGWSNRYIDITDSSTLAQLSGRVVALSLSNYTTDASPGEVTWFDDVKLTACYNPPTHAAFLPIVNNNSGTGPICSPPSENPPDSWYANRGFTQTGANCNSNLSQLDDRDYYSYTPSQTGSYTVHLRNLPNGSNWAVLVYNDVEPPPTGPTNGGACYTSQPGSADKSVVCTFNAGQNYVIKVSSGSTPMTGSYNMQVTKP